MDLSVWQFRECANLSQFREIKRQKKENCKELSILEVYDCVCVFIPSPVRVGTLLMEVPGTPIGASFFEFELKPTVTY